MPPELKRPRIEKETAERKATDTNFLLQEKRTDIARVASIQ